MAKFTLNDRLRSFRFALAGLRTMLIDEHNARVHLVATVMVVVAGVVFGLNREEWIWVTIATTSVWMAEAFNTAIERLGDAVTTEHHPQIGVAKDVSATAVLIASFCAALIGVMVFAPHLIRMLG